MAQAEDTELRDLVIDALEKNGSLAKIRALLRANIFLAFEDEYENMKQNESLNKVLQVPEGKLALSIIHEFLEFCNLRNTLFVYKSETRQGKEYTFDGENTIADKLNISKSERVNEPILLTILKNILKPKQTTNIYTDNKGRSHFKQNQGKSIFRDDQNCTYIVHEDSSTTSQTQSDNSSDEKNKIDLRLPLDHSDTDTSSDSMKGKTHSEYIPNKHIIASNGDKNVDKNKLISTHLTYSPEMQNYVSNNIRIEERLQDLKVTNNSTTDSTSYVEIKPLNPIDEVLINTTGLPFSKEKIVSNVSPQNSHSSVSKIDTLSPIHTLSSNSESLKRNTSHQDSNQSSKDGSVKYDNDVVEYSYDFVSPPVSGKKDLADKQIKSPDSIQEDLSTNKSGDNSAESHKQNSISSQSSVSISDVADLISEQSSKRYSNDKSKFLSSDQFTKSPNRDNVKVSDDSGDFSESPIPSLSNLSLDIHSD